MADNKHVQDPGTGAKFQKSTKRIINKDGSFNVIKEGVKFRLNDGYLYFINLSWGAFFVHLLSGYLFANLLFAGIYLSCGTDAFAGSETQSLGTRFLNCFYFSSQTFTTLGYGAISPANNAANLVASFEAFAGFLSFALATGLLFGRFSKPNARIRFSKNLIIGQVQNSPALLFRIVNDRPNSLMEVKAKVLLVQNERGEDGSTTRKYHQLELQIDAIEFFPLTWTIVHPINEKSPLYGLKAASIKEQNAEILIHIKGFDDVFSQTVHQRFSYMLNESVINKRFEKAFQTDSNGNIILDVDAIDALESKG